MHRLPFIAFLLFSAALTAFLYLGKPEQQGLTGSPMPALTLQAYTSSSAPQAPVTLYNLFASWCTPCIAELPLLEELGQDENVAVIGIAWQDKPEVLADWTKKHGNPFDAIYLDADGAYGIGLGMRGLPETYVVDAKGIIRYHHLGPVTPENMPEMREQIEKAMK